MHYELKRYSNTSNGKMLMARAALIAGLLILAIGGYCSLFAAQAGVGLSGQIRAHRHSAGNDGGILQGLSPVGNFFMNTANSGNIVVSTSLTGTIFLWKPSSAAFVAGFSNDDSFYVNNIGKNSWIGGYNTMSRGDYSLAFGTNVKNYRAASILGGYYLQNNAGNSIMFGSGPGFGMNAYAVNNDTGSIKFFPFTITSETRPMLNMKRDNTAEVVGVWNFTSTPTVNGVEISTYGLTIDNSKVLKAGDTMTGPLTLAGSSLTVRGGGWIDGAINISSGSAVATLDTYQILMGFKGLQQYRHAIHTEHNGSGAAGNVFKFYTWQPSQAPTDVGNVLGLTIDNSNVVVEGTATIKGSSFSVGTSTLVVSNGRVGVGATSSTSKFLVLSPDAGTSWDSAEPLVTISNLDQNGGQGWATLIKGGAGSATTKILEAQTYAGASALSVMGGGNVGIGTTAPASTMTVRGTFAIENAASVKYMGVDAFGHWVSSGRAPTAGTCANGSISPNSSDTRGTVNFSGANSTCEIVFASAWATMPECFLQSHDGSGTVNGAELSAHSATGFTFVPFTGSYGNLDHVHYFCIGAP